MHGLSGAVDPVHGTKPTELVQSAATKLEPLLARAAEAAAAKLAVRLHIIGHNARINCVGKSQSCMVAGRARYAQRRSGAEEGVDAGGEDCGGAAQRAG